MGDVVRAWPHDGRADIRGEPTTASPKTLAQMQAEGENAGEGAVRISPFSAGVHGRNVCRRPCAARTHTGHGDGPNGVRVGKDPIFPHPFLILTIRLSIYF